MLFVLGDIGELAFGVDAADDAVDEAGVLDRRVAWKMLQLNFSGFQALSKLDLVYKTFPVKL